MSAIQSRPPFKRLRRGGATAQDKLADLVDFHAANPGVTEASLGQCRMADGRTGYELLVSELNPSVGTVLELGAGNGPLLEALEGRTPPLSRIIGVDACAQDLELARTRLSSRVELLNDEAHALSLPDACVDAVLSHHALYLFEPADATLAEVRRVLSPGGRLLAVGWTLAPKGQCLLSKLMDELANINRAHLPDFRGWADTRWFDEQSLVDMLTAAGFDSVNLSEYALLIDEPAAVICRRLMDFFYSVHLHDDAARTELEASWLDLLRQHAAPMEFPFSLLNATRT